MKNLIGQYVRCSGDKYGYVIDYTTDPRFGVCPDVERKHLFLVTFCWLEQARSGWFEEKELVVVSRDEAIVKPTSGVHWPGFTREMEDFPWNCPVEIIDDASRLVASDWHEERGQFLIAKKLRENWC